MMGVCCLNDEGKGALLLLVDDDGSVLLCPAWEMGVEVEGAAGAGWEDGGVAGGGGGLESNALAASEGGGGGVLMGVGVAITPCE